MPQTKNDPDTRPIGAQAECDTDGPVRQCALTRERYSQDEMIRFVRSPDGVAVPDIRGKLPGRGAWLRAEQDTIERAIKLGTFSRAFKTETKPLENLVSMLQHQLAERCIGLIGMAKKSGQAVIGFDQVRAYLRQSEPGWLLEASDGAEDGRNKVHFLAKAIYEDVNVAGALSSAELGMAFGRDGVIHGLLGPGRLAESFGVAYRRLIGFRSAPETGWFSGRQAKR